MQKISALCGLALLCLSVSMANAQSADSLPGTVVTIPAKLAGRIQSKVTGLNEQLSRQTQRYLQSMARREDRLKRKLAAKDSTAASSLFAGAAEHYAALSSRIQGEAGSASQRLSGVYLPYLDSLQGSVAFLRQNPQLLKGGSSALTQLQGAGSQLQAFQAKLQDADVAKAFIQQRQQQMGAWLSQHADAQALLGKTYAGMKQDVYYYSQQLREYREIWTNPDAVTQKALGLLRKMPAFQTFMQQHSQLAGLFRVPGNYGSAASLSGLQTNSQVAREINQKVGAGGPGGAAVFKKNLQSAHSQLDDYKSKLSALGMGNGNMDMPDFRPNDQKTKTFWRRLEYGANFQTTRNNYMFPLVTDFGFSLGYKLGHENVVGVGASYKLGWGNGFQHIAFSSQGAGLRSFLQIRMKGTFSASGGFEYNYTTPFTSYQQIRQLQYWTKSGLLGVTKTVSTRGRVFKKTSISLLWDFLSYQAVPKTQPVLFRLGYTF